MDSLYSKSLVLNDLNVYSILQTVQHIVIAGCELILKTSRFGRVRGVCMSVWVGQFGSFVLKIVSKVCFGHVRYLADSSARY